MSISFEKSRMKKSQSPAFRKPSLNEQNGIFIGKTQDGAIVFDRPNSHLHEEARFVIEEAIAKINTLDRQFLDEEVDFGENIGSTSCVMTGKDDEIIYAQRLNRVGLTRFVVGRAPVPTSKVFVVLKKMNALRQYVLITAFLGSKAQPEPWDPRATAESFDFWKNRALVWGSAEIVESTATNICPWSK